MIEDIVVGDILSLQKKADIIIGMNTELSDVLGIGKRFVAQIRKTRSIALGSVISFEYDRTRELHMLVCHELGSGGWANADKNVRYGMDYLWNKRPDRKYSIVQIGTGRVGRRDGADHAAIRGAIASSYLRADLYVLPQDGDEIPAAATGRIHMAPVRMWDITRGEVPLQVAA
jgi:hypothetical protein